MTLADPYREYQIDYSPHEQSKAPEPPNQLVYESNHQPNPGLHHGGRPETAFISSGHNSQFQSQQQQQQQQHHQHTHHQSQHPQSHQSRHQQPQQQQQQQQQPSHPQSATVMMPSPGTHGVVRELQQPVMIPTPMVPPQLPPQLPPHFGSASLPVPYSSERHGKKRRRTDDGPRGENEDNTPGIGIAMLSEPSHHDEPHSNEMLLPAPGDPSSHHHHHQQQQVQHDYQTSPIHQHQHQHQHSQSHHHHHRLPSQATMSGQGGDGELASPGGVTGSQSVVGQPGMPDPAPRPRGPKLKFTPEEDSLLVELKENKNLTWKQIADFFPGRTSGTLQVRYCTKLRAKATVWTDEAVCFSIVAFYVFPSQMLFVHVSNHTDCITFSARTRTNPFLSRQVQRLRNAIQDYENDRWRIIATKVGSGFSPAACRDKSTEI